MASNVEENVKECIIHYPSHKFDDSPLLCVRDYESWESLFSAARVRNHEPILKIAARLKSGSFRCIYYHSTCMFRMKHLIEKLSALKRKADIPTSDQDVEPMKRPVRTSSADRTYMKECIFL